VTNQETLWIGTDNYEWNESLSSKVLSILELAGIIDFGCKVDIKEIYSYEYGYGDGCRGDKGDAKN